MIGFRRIVLFKGRLISVLEEQKLSIKEILKTRGLKDRENFMGNYLNPAIKEDFVVMFYPDNPKHPRLYRLTVKRASSLQYKVKFYSLNMIWLLLCHITNI